MPVWKGLHSPCASGIVARYWRLKICSGILPWGICASCSCLCRPLAVHAGAGRIANLTPSGGASGCLPATPHVEVQATAGVCSEQTPGQGAGAVLGPASAALLICMQLSEAIVGQGFRLQTSGFGAPNLKFKSSRRKTPNVRLAWVMVRVQGLKP